MSSQGNTVIGLIETRTFAGPWFWSVIVGSLLLFAFRGLQVVSGSGAVAPFPREIFWTYVVVELILFSFFLCFVSRARFLFCLRVSLILLFVLTSFEVRNWAYDFIPVAFGAELVWLAPWIWLATGKARQQPRS